MILNPWKKVRELNSKVQVMQHALDNMAATKELIGDGAGRYTSTASKVEELARKFKGEADYGNDICHNVITVRSSFTVGGGVKVSEKVKGKGERELAFIQQVFERNKISSNMPQEFAQEAEIEGRFLAAIIPTIDETLTELPAGPKTIDIRFMSWTQHGYTVHPNPLDYLKYDSVTFKVNKSGEEKTLQAPYFVYRPFGGRLNDVNDCPPKLGLMLDKFEFLDKAALDWRRINFLFASPTPHFDVTNPTDAKALDEYITKKGWKLGQALISVNAKFNMVEQSGSGANSLKDEMVATAKTVSGGTGVPVHFLGLPDLMSNRATADNLMELINASVGSERATWQGFYGELIEKCLKLANDLYGTAFDVKALKVDLPFVSSEKVKELAEVWLPIYQGGGITLEYFLSKVPDADVDEMAAKIKKDQTDALLEPMNFRAPNTPDDDQQDDNK